MKKLLFASAVLLAVAPAAMAQTGGLLASSEVAGVAGTYSMATAKNGGSVISGAAGTNFVSDTSFANVTNSHSKGTTVSTGTTLSNGGIDVSGVTTHNNASGSAASGISAVGSGFGLAVVH